MNRNETIDGSVENIQLRATLVLPLLTEAFVASRDVDARPWDFAVEIKELLNCGITPIDLRWMVCKGLIEHAHEIGLHERRFDYRGRLNFSKKSCFIVTPKGQRWIENQLSSLVSSSISRAEHGKPINGKAPKSTVTDAKKDKEGSSSGVSAKSEPQYGVSAGSQESGKNGLPQRRVANSKRVSRLKPTWDRETRQLYFGSRVVKEFRGPATNQVQIISTFDELSWPRRIDDPLPPTGDIEPKKRLHDTINAFNRNQQFPVIRFKGDGTGEGILWETVKSVAEEIADLDVGDGLATH